VSVQVDRIREREREKRRVPEVYAFLCASAADQIAIRRP